MAKRKVYDEDFKKMIVELYENKKPVCELKREYGLVDATIYRWINEYGKIKTETGKNTSNHEMKKLKKENLKLKEELEILKEYENSKGRYGSPKVQKALEKRGIKASPKRVARRMKKMGLKSIIVKKYRPSGSKGKVDDTNKPNLLAQNFNAEGLREKLVSDITNILLIKLRDISKNWI